MKWCCVACLVGLIVPGLVRGQVAVDILLEQEQFLRDESLPVQVRILNRSGQPLKLGDQPDWLQFHVEKRDATVVTRLKEVPVADDLTLESSQQATKKVDLMPCYELPPGRYSIRASVKIHQWNQEIMSRPKIIEIVRGIKLWEEVIGIPQREGPPEPRKFVLEQANYLKQPHLYARLTEPTETQIFRVLPLGRMLSISRPEAQIDRQNNLHVLFQTGARSFTYSVLNSAGELLRRQRHDYNQSRPALKSDGEGQIAVSGGIRHISKSDIPAPKTEEPPDAVPADQP